MTTSKNTYVPFILALVAGLLLGILFFYIARPTEDSPAGEGESVEVPGLGEITVDNPGVTIEEVKPVSGIPPRQYTTPLSFEAGTSEEVKAILQGKFEELQAALSKDSKDFNVWVRLGALRKQAGDYLGAAGDWEYVSKLYPQNIVSFGNLGNLYLDFLKDYEKAELNYKQQITNSPASEDAYSALFSLHTDYGYKTGTSAAKAILKEGIAAVPDSVSLRVLLARYYKEKGDTERAATQYDAAIAAAKTAGNTQAVSQLETEKAELE